MQPTTPQSQQSILDAINTLVGQYAGNVPIPTLPSLNYTAPSGNDLQSQYQQFLTRAANDPDIVNYYNNLLQQALGDTNVALNFLEQDYQNGTRNVWSNLSGSLQQLGLTSQGEQNQLKDTLNQRGIALTDNGNGQLGYATGGEGSNELNYLNQNQALRQEAETRSAQQQITGLGLTLQKGQTSAGQGLQQEVQGLNSQQQQDIANRANQYFGLYQSQQANNLANAQTTQQNAIFGTPTQSTQPTQTSVPKTQTSQQYI